VRRQLLAFAFLDEVGPLITLHTLWFADHGITAGQISAVFVAWAAAGMVLEVPSGALADRIDRRAVVAFAVALRAVAFVTWMLWPTLPGLVVGAMLWATHEALASGAWEALVYDQLSARGEADDYQRTYARLDQAGHAGIFAGTAAAWALLQADVSLATLGWLTAAVHAPSLWAIATLPAAPPELDHGDDGELTVAAWWRTLRAGVTQVGRRPVVGRLVAVAGALGGLFLLDEYVPLLARARDATDAQASLLVLAVWLGGLVGGEVAARRPALPTATAAAGLALASALTLAAVAGGPWWLAAAIGVAYGAQNLAWIVIDARLQERLDPRSRATATSVRELLSNGVSMGVLAVVGGLSVGDDPTAGLLVMLLALGSVAAAMARWVPDASRSTLRRRSEEGP